MAGNAPGGVNISLDQHRQESEQVGLHAHGHLTLGNCRRPDYKGFGPYLTL